MPPALTGQLIAILTVTDAARSASWYESLLEGRESSRYEATDGTVQVILTVPAVHLELCLVSRPTRGSDLFDERRVGLDHLEFVVATHEELSRWSHHLDRLGIVHSGIKEPTYSQSAMITLRDPDNIQLEFYWRGQEEISPPALHQRAP